MCMWYFIMKKFKCKVSSTGCKEKKRWRLLHTRQHGDEEKGKKSQLDYTIGPTERRDDVRICNDNKACLGYVGPVSD